MSACCWGIAVYCLLCLIWKHSGLQKVKNDIEITATVFPLLISVIVSLNVLLEEKASHFQILLEVPNRYKVMLTKLVVLYGAGIAALFYLFLVFLLGVHF